MSETTDIAVIGAGVAGAMAALKLARRGRRVLLIEKAQLPRDKVCGCCLNADAVAELRNEGLGDLLDTATPLHHADLLAAGRSATLRLPEGVVLSRRALDNTLVQRAANAGCTVRDRAVGRVISATPDRVQVALTAGGKTQTINAKLTLVADGLAGSALADHALFTRSVKPRSKRGYGTHLRADQHQHPAGRITMRCGRHGYVGAVVLENGSLDLAAALDPKFVKQCKGIAAAIERTADQAGSPLPIGLPLDALPWKATAELTGSRPHRWSAQLPGVLLLGDTAGYVEPFTGEGMAWALRGASAIIDTAEQIVDHGWTDNAGAAWNRSYQQQVAKRQWRCRAVAALLRRPRLTSGVVRLLGGLPRVTRHRLDALLAPGGLNNRASLGERGAQWR